MPEIGAFADLDPDSVLEALRLRLAATAVPLDEMDEQRLGAADEAIARVEDQADLGARLDRPGCAQPPGDRDAVRPRAFAA